MSTDGGSRAGKVVAYKPLLDRALALCQKPPGAVIIPTGAHAMSGSRPGPGLRRIARPPRGRAPVQWLESSEPSYILIPPAPPAGPRAQRDTGGYAVALASSMEYLFDGKPGDTYLHQRHRLVVGHSYHRLCMVR